MNTPLILTLITTTFLAASTALGGPTAESRLGTRTEAMPSGLRIVALEPSSPLAPYAKPGDVIVEIDDLAMSTDAAIESFLKRVRAGDQLLFTIDSAKGRFKFSITIGAAPSAPAPSPVVSSAPVASPTTPASTVTTHSTPDPTSAKAALVLAAEGPGEDGSAAGIAGAYNDRLYAQFHYVFGLSRVLSIDAQVRTQVSINELAVGARFHLYTGSAFSLAARVQANEYHILRNGVSLVLVGGNGGLMASFGTERLKWTAGCDVTLHLAGVIQGKGIPPGLVAYATRPYIAVEFAAGLGVNMFAIAEFSTLQIEGADTIVSPGGAFGVAF